MISLGETLSHYQTIFKIKMLLLSVRIFTLLQNQVYCKYLLAYHRGQFRTTPISNLYN